MYKVEWDSNCVRLVLEATAQPTVPLLPTHCTLSKCPSPMMYFYYAEIIKAKNLLGSARQQNSNILFGFIRKLFFQNFDRCYYSSRLLFTFTSSHFGIKLSFSLSTAQFFALRNSQHCLIFIFMLVLQKNQHFSTFKSS